MASVLAALAALTKGGLDAMAPSLAVEYATWGIRVNTVSPGMIKTPMHSPATPEFLAGLQPMGRMGETHDVVDAVLISERRHS
jgi:NAD(P)-dependent dehydrogenase (short-subunit alcohol dehydrogenase family)